MTDIHRKNVTKCHIIVHNNGLIYCYLG